jgi:hypothetical protein
VNSVLVCVHSATLAEIESGRSSSVIGLPWNEWPG